MGWTIKKKKNKLALHTNGDPAVWRVQNMLTIHLTPSALTPRAKSFFTGWSIETS